MEELIAVEFFVTLSVIDIIKIVIISLYVLFMIFMYLKRIATIERSKIFKLDHLKYNSMKYKEF